MPCWKLSAARKQRKVNSQTLAAKTLRKLLSSNTALAAPWLAIYPNIYSGAQIATMPDDELRARPQRMCGFLWSLRGYCQPGRTCQDTSIWVTGDSDLNRCETPMVLFWPPYRHGAPFEFIWSWGEDEAMYATVAWLIQQPIDPYNGARNTVKLILYQGLRVLEPIPLDFDNP